MTRPSPTTTSVPPPLCDENLLSLTEAAKCLPAVDGRRHTPAALYRWCRRGINGVRLEYVRVGGTLATSREALRRFFAALAEADSEAPKQLPRPSG